MTQFLFHHCLCLTVAGYFERPFQVVHRCVEVAAPAVYLAQPHPRDQILDVGAEHAVEHVGGGIILIGFEHRLAQQPVGAHVFGVLLQDVPPVGYGFWIATLLNDVLDLLTVFVKGNLGHFSLLLPTFSREILEGFWPPLCLALCAGSCGR